MNTIVRSALRTVALVSVLLFVPGIAAAKDPAASDSAAGLLATAGTVPVKAVGPYVEIGSFRIWVATKLGQPSATLADGTWLYRNRSIDGSDVRGTLVVRFVHGKVSELSLVSPRVETVLLTTNPTAKTLVAAK